VSGNQRVFYSCLGVSVGGGSRLAGATSVGISGSRSISNIYASQNKNAVATYANLPEIEISVGSYLSSFVSLENEPGLNSWTTVEVYAGSDTCPVLAANQKNVFNYVLLDSIKYNLPADGFFTVERSYKGINKKPCTVNETCNETDTGTDGIVKTRQYYVDGRPSVIGDNPISNISIDAKINRNFVGEFGTRKPYAAYINFPIEIACTYECTVQDFDSISFDLEQTACKNGPSYKESINVNICGSSFSIPDAQLTAFSYSGAEAGDNSNLKLSVTYTGYSTPANIAPVIILPDNFTSPC
jgi:hypothetical protein